MNKELRGITKSFRTTRDTVNKLNVLKNYESYKSFTESDIINQAMKEFAENSEFRSKLIQTGSGNMAVLDKINRLHLLQKETNKLLDEIEDKRNLRLRTPTEAIKFIRGLCPLDKEILFIIFLDSNETFIDYKKINEGSLGRTTSDIRLIIKEAMDMGAASIITLHNHPSGLAVPSDPDILTTGKTYFACECVEISLLDSIIIGKGRKFYSFNNEGWINAYKKQFYKTYFTKILPNQKKKLKKERKKAFEKFTTEN
jgi:DNA repair protein RadC